MNMIEKVARATAEVIAKRHNDKNKDGSLNIEYWLSEARYEEAKAAIAAMREPSSEMCKAIDYNSYTIDGYEIMIDAALKE